jgi:16S rRNA (guanine527-N7)-methyltransferase
MSQPPSADPIAPLTPPDGFASAAASLGVEFDPGDVERLGRFLALLLHANETTNLTAITDPVQAWTKHILDALSLVPVLASLETVESTKTRDDADERPAAKGVDGAEPVARQLSVVDIGSGGGVPAIPLAIVMPNVWFTMVESTGKKVEFLNRAITELGLTNARVLQARAETLGQEHKVHREHYDAGIARALGHLAVVAELCGPLVRPHGIVIAVKGAKAEQELGETAKAMGLLGLRHVQTSETPTGRLVIMEKTTRTPRTYPRKDGEPGRVPLGVPREK